MALLEDESPHLRCLAIRCLADLACHEEERRELREDIVGQGRLVRELLEGEDMDIVEAAARMMLNLHADIGAGQPIQARLRGPRAFADQALLASAPALAASAPPTPASTAASSAATAAASLPATPSSAAAASAWAGAWEGEMRYARCGDRHAALRLVLGPAGSPATECAMAEFLPAPELSAAEAAPEDGTEDGAPEVGSTPPRRREMLCAEGSAEYWNFFGFFPSSDFDCGKEKWSYCDEVSERRRQQPASPSAFLPPAKASASGMMLAGAGWDEQNGPFLAEATFTERVAVPQRPSSQRGPQNQASFTANAVPLRLTLKYLTRGGTFEFTAFIAGDDEPVLYGVWATAPSHHKHLFSLRRAAPQPGSSTAGKPWGDGQ